MSAGGRSSLISLAAASAAAARPTTGLAAAGSSRATPARAILVRIARRSADRDAHLVAGVADRQPPAAVVGAGRARRAFTRARLPPFGFAVSLLAARGTLVAPAPSLAVAVVRPSFEA